MRIVVTGGGTGGHVYPALEVGLAARDKGWSTEYFGSERGRESDACAKVGMPIQTFNSEPVYRIASYRGIRALVRMLKATRDAARALDENRPHVIFSTGGYGSVPVANAASKLNIPLVLHEQNSVPGRSNRIMGRYASAICTVFHSSAGQFDREKVERTGLPIRRELRDSSQGRLPIDQGSHRGEPIMLVFGGSQGSAALNDVALSTAVRMTDERLQWIHLSGVGLFDQTSRSLDKLALKDAYTVKAYLEADEMAQALFSCTLAICRSGAGTMAELAAFRKPSILIPYPHAHAQHQLKNAEEFAEIGAADLLEQADLHPVSLEGRIRRWLYESERTDAAQKALAEWDVPNAVERVIDVLSRVGGRP